MPSTATKQRNVALLRVSAAAASGALAAMFEGSDMFSNNYFKQKENEISTNPDHLYCNY